MAHPHRAWLSADAPSLPGRDARASHTLTVADARAFSISPMRIGHSHCSSAAPNHRMSNIGRDCRLLNQTRLIVP
ncbi:hypothetical protein NDU88_005543 [Pleurodeles waltl]|uniref:Uncharacterized protein n=1 Tax=Pleurodeles waltl TaxID=8319 RepID=A0AAV7QID9_PLEWA|nr:hypothetical protein NDU88_005543 [Pleurodeles waltl]